MTFEHAPVPDRAWRSPCPERVVPGRVVLDGGNDQGLHRRLALASIERKEETLELAPRDGRNLAIDRVIGLPHLALLAEVGVGQRVRDQLQSDLRLLGRKAAHAPDDPQDPCFLIAAADRHQRVERELRRGAHRRIEAEARRADVLHLPGSAGRRERGEPPRSRPQPGTRLARCARRLRVPSYCRNCGRCRQARSRLCRPGADACRWRESRRWRRPGRTRVCVPRASPAACTRDRCGSRAC